MNISVPRFVVCTGVAVVLQACLPTEPCACPPARTHAVVFGSVLTGSGMPAAGAEVQATVYPSVCGRDYPDIDPDANPVRVDSTGRYELRLHSLFGPRAACVRVIARSLTAATDSTAVDAAILLRNEHDEPERARVDIVLR